MSILVNAQEHREAVSKSVAARAKAEAARGLQAAGKKSPPGVPLPGFTPRRRAAGKLGAATGAAKGKLAVEKGLTNGDIAREVLATPKPRLFGKKRDAAERTRARGVLADPKVAGAEDDYWLKAAPVSKSAFGVELGEVEKGLGYGKLGRKASTAAKDTIKLEFKKPKPGVTPTGPGSQRGSMSASAWESRTAAARRSS